MNSYGLTPSEAEAILNIDILSSLLEAKKTGGDALALQVATLDENVAQYLKTKDVEAILEENRKEAIGDDDDFGDFDFGEDFDDLDFDTADDIDIRITDSDAPPMATPKTGAKRKKERSIPMLPSVTFSDISASNFFSEVVRNHVPQIDSEGALVVEPEGLRVRGIFQDDFGVIGSLPMSAAKMNVMVLGNDAEKVTEYKPFEADVKGSSGQVDAGLMSLPLEEVSSVFSTQQFLRGGKEVNVSFDSILSILNRANEGELDALDFPAVGKAVHPYMVKDSVYYYSPDQLYLMANCDEFYTASVGGYRYITNYCEANDLKQLRIFEIGGNHLNVPFNNTQGKTISNSKMEADANQFGSRVNKIVGDGYSVNERLYMVGFTHKLPSEIKYAQVDSLSDMAGYYVFALPTSSRNFYIPAVIFNYFRRFYGVDGVVTNPTPNQKQFTLFFKTGDDIAGFIMIDEKNAPSGSPVRMLPTNPKQYKEQIMGENLTRFSDLVDVSELGDAEFIGKVVERVVDETKEIPVVEPPKVEETKEDDDTLQEFRDLIEELQMVLGLMEEGEDDEEIAELNEAIEGAQIMIDALSEDEDEAEMLEQIQSTPPIEDEAGLEAIGNDQEILPTPSADDPVAETIVEEEKKEVLEADKAKDFKKVRLTFTFNPDNLPLDDAVEMVEKYTNDWRSFGDISETTISANLNFEDADDLIPELPEGYVYDVQMFEKDTDGKEVLIFGEPEIVEEDDDDDDDIEVDALSAIEDADSEDDMDIVLVDKMPDIPEGEEILVNPEVTLDDENLDDDDFDFGDEDFDFDDDDFAKGGVISESKLKKMLRDDDMEWSSDKEFFEVATNAGYDYDQDEEGWREMDSFNEGPYGDYAKGGKTGKYTIHLSKDLGLDDEFRYHVVGPDGGVIGCQSKKECQEVISLAKRGIIEMEKGGKTIDDKVSDKIRLLRKEGKPQNQAVAIALSMRDSGKLASGGQTNKVLENAKKAVADMSDAEVAETLVDVLFSSLEAFEYETTEADALKEAKKDIEHSRELLINILEEATSIA